MALSLSIMVVGCAPSVTVAPINPSPTGERHTGKFVWHDIVTHDADAARRFYTQLFGWEAEPRSNDGDPFVDFSHRGRPIASMVEMPRGDVSRARWISYMSVPDVDQAIRLVVSQGGAVLAEPRDVETRGRIAVVRDPRGAVFGLVNSATGDPPDRQTSPGGFLWDELWTDDVSASVDFYHALAGYRHVVVDFSSGGDYDLLQADERPRGGLVRIPFDEVRPNWLPYVLVDDPVALIRRVEDLGGAVLLAPHEELRDGSVAIISDPSGAALTLQKWPIDGEGQRGFQ